MRAAGIDVSADEHVGTDATHRMREAVARLHAEQGEAN